MHPDDNALLIRVPRDYEVRLYQPAKMGINVNIYRQPNQRSLLDMNMKERLDFMNRGVDLLEKKNTVPIPGFKKYKNHTLVDCSGYKIEGSHHLGVTEDAADDLQNRSDVCAVLYHHWPNGGVQYLLPDSTSITPSLKKAAGTTTYLRKASKWTSCFN